MSCKDMTPAIKASPWSVMHRNYPNGVKFGNKSYSDWCYYLQFGHENKDESLFYKPAYRYTKAETKNHWD